MQSFGKNLSSHFIHNIMYIRLSTRSYTAKTDGLHEPNMGYLGCTAACPMRFMMLRSNVITFVSTTALNNAKFINEALVALFAEKKNNGALLSV